MGTFLLNNSLYSTLALTDPFLRDIGQTIGIAAGFLLFLIGYLCPRLINARIMIPIIFSALIACVIVGGIDRVEYNCQGYSGNDPVISLDVIGEKGEVLCIGFSRYDQSFLGLITDTSRKIREAVPKDVTGEGITEITEEYSSSSF